jgi:hypothetical protein
MEDEDRNEVRSSRRWQIGAGLLVALGCLATFAYTVVETFWG